MFNQFIVNNLPLILLVIWVLSLTCYVVFCIKSNDEEEYENEILNKEDVPRYGTVNDFTYIKL